MPKLEQIEQIFSRISSLWSKIEGTYATSSNPMKLIKACMNSEYRSEITGIRQDVSQLVSDVRSRADPIFQINYHKSQQTAGNEKEVSAKYQICNDEEPESLNVHHENENTQNKYALIVR